VIGKLPYPVKQGIKYAYGALPPQIRYGKVFWETYNFLQKSQWWSKEKLEEYQMQQLSKLLSHAYKNVPYYRRIFDERGLKPEHIQDLDDLRKLPYLDKNSFKRYSKDLLARNTNPKDLHRTHTSGTTGKPLQFYQHRSEIEREWAFVCHQWSRVGYRPGDARVELRGAVDRRKFIYYNPGTKVLRLAPIIDTKERVRSYLEHMERFGAKFLHGYPGAIAAFAFAIRYYGLAVPVRFRAVLFASEAVYDWEREIVREVFECREFAFYGQTEHVVIAAECEYSSCYHCIPQYGITEIDPDTYEIIGTGFLNYANPFIRYRTTDIASMPISSRCEKCGRNYFPVFAKVEGRLEDFIITPEGTLIAPAIITHPFKDLKTVKDTQIVQKDLDLVVVRAVPWAGKDSQALQAELRQLCQDLQIILGKSVQVKWEIVEEIERTTSGKFKWIVSEVSRDSLEKGIKEI